MKKILFTILLSLIIPASVYASFTIKASTSTPNRGYPFQLETTSINGVPIADFFLGSTVQNILISASSSITFPSQDLIDKTSFNSIVQTKCQINSNGSVFTSITPGIGTTDQTGSTTYVSNGTAQFNVSIQNRTRGVFCPFNQNGAGTTTISIAYSSTSTATEMINETSARINSLTPDGTNNAFYSSINDTTHTYVRNTGFVMNAVATSSVIDVTAIPATTSFGQTGSGILIAPDIILTARHVCGHAPGGVWYFVDNSNNTIIATSTSFTTVGDLNADICLYKLSAPVSSAITPAKVFPANAFVNYISQAGIFFHGIPFMMTNQFRTIGTGILYGVDMESTRYFTATSSSSIFNTWFYQVRGGDSGTPAFAILNGGIVAIGTWQTASAASTISLNHAGINAAISALGTSFQLTDVNLSSYAVF